MKQNTNTKAVSLLLSLFLLAGTAAAQTAPSDDNAQTIQQLKQQVEALGQKVHALEQEQGVRESGAGKPQPVLSIGANGVAFRSADTNFGLTLHGVLQVDSRSFFADHNIQGNDGFLLRRARPILSGTLFRDFDYMFVPDFGGSTVQIQDAYLNYRLTPAWQLQAGKFKSPVGLEQLQSDPYTLFNERSLVTDLVPNRDLGVELHGDLFSGRASYAFGIFNGAPDYSGTTTNAPYMDNKAFAGRVFVQPFKNSTARALRGIGFGVGGSFEVDHAWTNTTATGLTPGFTTDGQQKFFAYSSGVVGDGPHWRLSPQGSYYYGPFSLMGEYVISDQKVNNVPKGLTTALHNSAWEVSAGWVLTGEDASFTGVTPRHNFDPFSGGWGAWQLVARYAELSVDPAAFPNYADPLMSAQQAAAWSAGLNWYLNRDLRVNIGFSRTTFTGGSKGAVTKQPENVLFTRMQLTF